LTRYEKLNKFFYPGERLKFICTNSELDSIGINFDDGNDELIVTFVKEIGPVKRKHMETKEIIINVKQKKRNRKIECNLWIYEDWMAKYE
jgi:hypothetical protein